MYIMHPTVSPHITDLFNSQGLNNPDCKPSYAYMAITVLGKLAGATHRYQGAKVRAHAFKHHGLVQNPWGPDRLSGHCAYAPRPALGPWPKAAWGRAFRPAEQCCVVPLRALTFAAILLCSTFYVSIWFAVAEVMYCILNCKLWAPSHLARGTTVWVWNGSPTGKCLVLAG